jgi:uncharacterized OB-fold protein
VTEPLVVAACADCGHAVHPPRILCPACGGARWRPVAAAEGWAEEVTRHEASGVRLASVRTDRGPRVIARAADEVVPGARVALVTEDGVLVAR